MMQDGRCVISVLSFCCLLAVCKEGIVHYYEGDMWNVTNCKFCICRNGQKSCSFAQCAKIKCGEVNIEQIYHIVQNNAYQYFTFIYLNIFYLNFILHFID